MTSKLAKGQIEKMWAEGLKPTFEDIIQLNGLGLAVERCPDCYNLYALPRVGFLGDYTFYEPTVFKQLWIENALRLVDDDLSTHLYTIAYALNTPDHELPQPTNTRKLAKEVKKFAEEVLIDFTLTQILMMVEYVLKGSDPAAEVDFTDDEKKDFAENICAVPDDVYSNAQQLLNQALSKGMDADVKYQVTVPELDRMVICALLKDGVDVLKDERCTKLGKFYQCLGKMRTRLTKEQKITEEGNTNG